MDQDRGFEINTAALSHSSFFGHRYWCSGSLITKMVAKVEWLFSQLFGHTGRRALASGMEGLIAAGGCAKDTAGRRGHHGLWYWSALSVLEAVSCAKTRQLSDQGGRQILGQTSRNHRGLRLKVALRS